jgi:L-arabinose isomerase
MLCANTGEADFNAAVSADAIEVIRTGSVTGKEQRGVSLRLRIAPSPATVVGFTPIDHGWRIIVMSGDILGQSPANLKVPHHLFRPHLECRQAFSQWIEAGATHHACISLAAHQSEFAEVAHHLKIDFKAV